MPQKYSFFLKQGSCFAFCLESSNQESEYLTRGSEGAQKTESAGVVTHRLEKPPIVDNTHVILWAIKAVDIRFQMEQYREKKTSFSKTS